MAEPLTAGATLVAFLDDEIPAERARKNSLEVRALSVISSAGTLVTLLFGLSAVITRVTSFRPSLPTLVLLSVAATLFVISAILAIYCNMPGHYFEVDPMSLVNLTKEAMWTSKGSGADREVALARLEVLNDWKQVNQRKARVLATAALTEVLAVATTAAAVFFTLLG